MMEYNNARQHTKWCALIIDVLIVRLARRNI